MDFVNNMNMHQLLLKPWLLSNQSTVRTVLKCTKENLHLHEI